MQPSLGVSQTDCFLARLVHQPAVLVSVALTQGSAPREAGAWMAVFADRLIGTVGGGHLEYQAIAQARAWLSAAQPEPQGPQGPQDPPTPTPTPTPIPAPAARLPAMQAPVRQRFALGPSLGQCCGGVVFLDFEPVSACDAPALALRLRAALTPVALFGGGHVGQALVPVLARLPFFVTWVDSREAVFPAALPAQARCEPSEPVQRAVPGLAPQSRVLVMSFSHAEDLEVVAACLQRQRGRADLPYIGLIGSRSKWAAFQRRLQARGFTPEELAHVTCPIGVAGISGKAPDVIAVAVAAQLLQTLGPS